MRQTRDRDANRERQITAVTVRCEVQEGGAETESGPPETNEGLSLGSNCGDIWVADKVEGCSTYPTYTGNCE